jgi:FixJ family two-component response regulator
LEAVVEDRRTPVPDQVWLRVDFPAWLETLPRRERQVAESLMLGKTNGEVAREAGVSPSRVSRLRRELEASWFGFRGEAAPVAEKKAKKAA